MSWFTAADKDGGGKISRQEFFLWSLSTASQKFGADGLLSIFRRYDADASGSLSCAEFSRAVEDMGWDSVVAKELFDELPHRNDGSSVGCDYLSLINFFNERAASSALDQLTLSFAWEAKRYLSKADVGHFASTSVPALRETLCEILTRNGLSIEDIFPRQDYALTLSEFKRGLKDDCFFSGNPTVLQQSFALLDVDSTGKIGLRELSNWVFRTKPMDVTSLRRHIRKLLSTDRLLAGDWMGGRVMPTDVVRAWAALREVGSPTRQGELLKRRAQGDALSPSNTEEGPTRLRPPSAHTPSPVQGGFAVLAAQSRPRLRKLGASTLENAWAESEANIDKATFLKRCRTLVGDDAEWYSSERSRVHQMLVRVGDAATDENAIDVIELCMWLDGIPIHRDIEDAEAVPADDAVAADGADDTLGKVLILGKLNKKFVPRPGRSEPSAARRWSARLETVQRPASARAGDPDVPLFHRRLADRERRSVCRLSAAMGAPPASPREMVASARAVSNVRRATPRGLQVLLDRYGDGAAPPPLPVDQNKLLPSQLRDLVARPSSARARAMEARAEVTRCTAGGVPRTFSRRAYERPC